MPLLELVVSLYVGLFELHFGLSPLIRGSIWTGSDCPRIGSPFFKFILTGLGRLVRNVKTSTSNCFLTL